MSDTEEHPIAKAFRELREAARRTDKAMSAYAVILGAAKLDVSLERLLLSLMPQLSAKMRKDIFTGTGPMATSAAKVKMAYALGLITKEMMVNLQLIGEMRNKFAHSPEVIDPDDPELGAKLLAVVCNKETPQTPIGRLYHLTQEIQGQLDATINGGQIANEA